MDPQAAGMQPPPYQVHQPMYQQPPQMYQQPPQMYQQPQQMYQPQPKVVYQQAPPPQQQTITTNVTTNVTQQSSGFRDAIPELPMCLAIILCIINCFFPGIGTVLAGFCVLCCGNVGQSGGGRFGTFYINFWVGWLQLALVVVFVGWVWSVMWGYAFIAVSGAASQRQQQTTTTSTVVTTSQAVPQQVVAY